MKSLNPIKTSLSPKTIDTSPMKKRKKKILWKSQSLLRA
jgi:hypothetical protein